MITLSYRSDANLIEREDQIAIIVDDGKKNNLKLGLTSVLLFDGARFMQTLEGPQSVVSNIFHKIMDDGRHRNVIPFGVSRMEKRKFPDWSLRWVGIAESIRIIPDMHEFDFSDRRLREINEEVLAGSMAGNEH